MKPLRDPFRVDVPSIIGLTLCGLAMVGVVIFTFWLLVEIDSIDLAPSPAPFCYACTERPDGSLAVRPVCRACGGGPAPAALPDCTHPAFDWEPAYCTACGEAFEPSTED